MSINLNVPDNIVLKPRITVFGVGGAGGNAINNMISANLEGADFVVANTDAQALEYSKAPTKIQLGENKTRGLGAGACPEVGKEAAEESKDLITQVLEGSNMAFITAGMGGGTGTGAAPVIASIARSKGILTVGVVTKPFHFEGSHRMKLAESGLSELQKYVDTLIIIPNQNLFRVANERTTFADAFKMADDVLHAGVRGVTDLITMPGLINLDFADIVTVMSKMGKAMMGTGESSEENRAIMAAEAAISNPLLDQTSMKGARGVLINITGGPDMTLFEVDEAANRIREEVDNDANIIFGSTFNPALEGKIRITVVATGIDSIDVTSHNSAGIERKIVTSDAIAQEEKDRNNDLIESNDNDLDKELGQKVEAIARDNDEEEGEELEIIEKEIVSSQPVYNGHNIQKPFHQNIDLDMKSPKNTIISTSAAEITKPTEAKKKGIFSRMASSMFGINSNNKLDEDEIELNINEEDIEIPAFLRRKNK